MPLKLDYFNPTSGPAPVKSYPLAFASVCALVSSFEGKQVLTNSDSPITWFAFGLVAALTGYAASISELARHHKISRCIAAALLLVNATFAGAGIAVVIVAVLRQC